jgi:hypothetical protein
VVTAIARVIVDPERFQARTTALAQELYETNAVAVVEYMSRTNREVADYNRNTDGIHRKSPFSHQNWIDWANFERIDLQLPGEDAVDTCEALPETAPVSVPEWIWGVGIEPLPGSLAIELCDELPDVAPVSVDVPDWEGEKPSLPGDDAVEQCNALPDVPPVAVGELVEVEVDVPEPPSVLVEIAVATTQKAVNAIQRKHEGDNEVSAACASKLKALRSAAAKRGAAARKAS